MLKSGVCFCFLGLFFVRKLMLSGVLVEFLGLSAGDVFGEMFLFLGVLWLLVVPFDVGVMVLCIVVFVESCLPFDSVGVLLLEVLSSFPSFLFISSSLSPVFCPSAGPGLVVSISCLSNSASLSFRLVSSFEVGVLFFVIVESSCRRSWYSFYRGENLSNLSVVYGNRFYLVGS